MSNTKHMQIHNYQREDVRARRPEEPDMPMLSLLQGSLLSDCCWLSANALQLTLMSSMDDFKVVDDMLRLRLKRPVFSGFILAKA